MVVCLLRWYCRSCKSFVVVPKMRSEKGKCEGEVKAASALRFGGGLRLKKNLETKVSH